MYLAHMELTEPDPITELKYTLSSFYSLSVPPLWSVLGSLPNFAVSILEASACFLLVTQPYSPPRF